eukprot:7984047-Pyramimonas_sp.AAC.1
MPINRCRATHSSCALGVGFVCSTQSQADDAVHTAKKDTPQHSTWLQTHVIAGRCESHLACQSALLSKPTWTYRTRGKSLALSVPAPVLRALNKPRVAIASAPCPVILLLSALLLPSTTPCYYDLVFLLLLLFPPPTAVYHAA